MLDIIASRHLKQWKKWMANSLMFLDVIKDFL